MEAQICSQSFRARHERIEGFLDEIESFLLQYVQNKTTPVKDRGKHHQAQQNSVLRMIADEIFSQVLYFSYWHPEIIRKVQTSAQLL